VTIRYLDEQAEDAPNEAAKKKEVEAFNASHPNIEVKREALAPDDIVKIINARLGSNNPPDVFTYGTGAGFGGVLAKNGLISPIDDAYEKYGWKSYDWAKERGNYGGKVYAVPDQVEELGIYYNKDLFAEWGVEEPKTLEELTAIADKAKENDIIPFAFGDKDQWPAGHQFSMTISNLLGRKGLDEILYGDGKWNSPEGVRRSTSSSSSSTRRSTSRAAWSASATTTRTRCSSRPCGDEPDGNMARERHHEQGEVRGGLLPVPVDRRLGDLPAGRRRCSAVRRGEVAEPRRGARVPQLPDDRRGGAEAEADLLQRDPGAAGGDGRARDLAAVRGGPDRPREGADDSDAFGYNIDVLTPQNFNQVMSQGFQDVLSGKRSPQEQADALQAAWEEAKAAGDILAKP
jgi:raffinose/stachyose/melibiose transport system substrate-binding protein